MELITKGTEDHSYSRDYSVPDFSHLKKREEKTPEGGTITWEEQSRHLHDKSKWESKSFTFKTRSYKEWQEFLKTEADTQKGSDELNLFMAAAYGRPKDAPVIGYTHEGKPLGWESNIKNLDYKGPGPNQLKENAVELMKAILLTEGVDLADEVMIKGFLQEGSYTGLTNLPGIMTKFCKVYMPLALHRMKRVELDKVDTEVLQKVTSDEDLLSHCMSAAVGHVGDIVNAYMHNKDTKHAEEKIHRLATVVRHILLNSKHGITEVDKQIDLIFDAISLIPVFRLKDVPVANLILGKTLDSAKAKVKDFANKDKKKNLSDLFHKFRIRWEDFIEIKVEEVEKMYFKDEKQKGDCIAELKGTKDKIYSGLGPWD